MSIRILLAVALATSILIAGCEGPSPTPTLPPPTAVPSPTATPVPATPTATPVSEAPPPHTGSGGGVIAFSSRRGDLSSRRGERDYEIVVMNADGTDKRLVTDSPFEDESPSWSPDGTRIAYTNSNYAGHCDIYVVDVYGTNERQRLTTEGNLGSLAWSPDGKYIVFSQHAHGSGNTLYIMAAPDGTDADDTDKQPLTATGMTRNFSEPTWSPDGRYIACAVDANPDPLTPETTICILDVQEALQKGGAVVTDLRALPRASARMNDKPTWSPDGTQIAFSAMIDDHRDIYIVNVDGTGLRPLTQTRDLDEHDPAWSPDGTHIVFQGNPDANWDIFVIAVSDEPHTDMTGWLRLTTDVANDTSPDWVP